MKDRANRIYGWMEANPATAALVSGGFAAVLAVALTIALGLYSSAKYVQKTACSKNPASKECADLRLEVAKAEPLRNPCASYQRVTSRRGRNCKHFYIPQLQPGRRKGPESSGGDAPQPGPTGTLQRSPQDGGGGNGAGGGGSDHGPAPGKDSGGQTVAPAPDPDPVPAPTSPTASSPGRSSDAPGNPEPPADPPRAVPSALEAAGEAVRETGKGAGEAVEGVGKGVDCALRGGC